MSTPIDGKVHSVEGHIRFEHGLPADRIGIRVYHRGYGCTATLLSQTITGDDGSYRLTYNAPAPLTNLEVRALDDRGEEVSLSATRYRAQDREILNLVAPASVRPLRPEYDRLRQDLAVFLREGGTLADARENPKCQDISLLHRSTRWDARLIALLAVAARLSRETGLEEEVLYALLRSGLPHKKELLAHVSTESVVKALNKAIETNIVSLTEEQIRAATAAFETFARQTRRTAKATGAPSTFAELLGQSGLTAAEQTRFEDLYFNHKGDGAELWTKAAQQGISDEKIQRLQVQGKLAYLTLNNATLTDKLGIDFKSPEALSALVDQDLYKEDEWTKRITEIAGSNEAELAKLIPPAYQGDTTGERLKAYASDLARKVRTSLPTRVVAG